MRGKTVGIGINMVEVLESEKLSDLHHLDSRDNYRIIWMQQCLRLRVPPTASLLTSPSENVPEKTFGIGTSVGCLRAPIHKSVDSHNASDRMTAIVG